MRLLPILFLLLAAGCASAPSLQNMSAPTPSFDAIRFFLGRTHGEGEVKAMMSPASRLEVLGQGRLESDGTSVLDQVIQRQGARPEQRQWRIRQVAPGSYRGTLTTAEGPVIGQADGNRLRMRYRLKDGGLEARQWIYLQPDGRTALNRLRLSKFGMPVAAVEETIRKLG